MRGLVDSSREIDPNAVADFVTELVGNMNALSERQKSAQPSIAQQRQEVRSLARGRRPLPLAPDPAPVAQKLLQYALALLIQTLGCRTVPRSFESFVSVQDLLHLLNVIGLHFSRRVDGRQPATDDQGPLGHGQMGFGEFFLPANPCYGHFNKIVRLGGGGGFIVHVNPTALFTQVGHL